MLFLTLEQLRLQGVSDQEVINSPLIKCSNRLFSRGVNFDKNERQSAIDICRKHIQSGIFSFIAETEHYFTVWKQEKEETLKNAKTQEQDKRNQSLKSALSRDYQISVRKGSSETSFSKTEMSSSKLTQYSPSNNYQIFIRQEAEGMTT